MIKFPLIIVRRSIWAGILAQVETFRKQSVKMMGTVEKLTDANIELYTKCKAAEAQAETWKRESRSLEAQNRALRKRIAELEKK